MKITWYTTAPKYLFDVATRPRIRESELCSSRADEDKVLAAMWRMMKAADEQTPWKAESNALRERYNIVNPRSR
mgnify:CR=1 FL=1